MNTSVAKYSAEFNLKTSIPTSDLTAEQIEALKKRMVAGNISVVCDSAMRQIRIDAASSDIDNAISSAIKLEQSSSSYNIDSQASGGTAKTNISMSSRGNADYKGCLTTLVVIGAIAGVILSIICSSNKKSHRTTGRPSNAYQRPSYPQKSYGGNYRSNGYRGGKSDDRFRY